MNQAWKSISGFIVSSTSNFDQLKISFYTEIKKNNKLKKKKTMIWWFVSLDMIFISKRVINFHPSISRKANGITSHYSGQPRTVTSSYKYAAPNKDLKKLTLFYQIIIRFKLEALYSVSWPV